MHNSYCATGSLSVALIPDRTFLEDSPAQMVVDLQAGSIDGYCVGNLEPPGAIEGWFYRIRI